MESLNFPSLLDKDDINGPGLGRFSRTEKGFSVDFAVFKISLYAISESPSEKFKFIKDLETLALQLGSGGVLQLLQLLETIANDRVQFRFELAKVLPKVLKTIPNDILTQFQENISSVLDPLFGSKIEVLVCLSDNFSDLLSVIPEQFRLNWLVSCILKIIHGEEREKVEIGVGLLNKTVPFLTPEVCDSFLLPEVLVMSQSETVSRMCAVELLPSLLKKSEVSKNKLVELFLSLCEDNEATVKLNCLKQFEKMFEVCEDSVVIQKLQPAFKEFLKSSNEKIRHSAHLQLGPLIYASKAPIPHALLELYLKLAKTVPSDKELTAHCAFYFPAVLEKMGKESWELLGETFLFMCRSNDVNTKKSCIASLHHVFRIVEQDVNEELIRIFLDNLNDKAFRGTVMQNLDEFMKFLPQNSRSLILEPLKLMIKDKNFRVRGLVSTKIAEIGKFFLPLECFSHFWPICKTLCLDSVGYVRNSAMQGIGACAVYIVSEIPDYSNEVIKDLKKFGRSAKSIHRLVFASACYQLVDLVEFEAAFGDDFYLLCKDQVAAVRITCAKAVSKVKSLRKFWVELKETLKTDPDQDVRKEITGVNPHCLETILAGQSQTIIKAPSIRNKLKNEAFEEIWEFQSTDSQFDFMIQSLRPSHKGWVLINT